MNRVKDIEKSIFEASNESLATFLENSTVGIHLENRDGIILYANEAELEMLGYTREEYFGHCITEFHEEKLPIEYASTTLLKQEKVIN